MQLEYFTRASLAVQIHIIVALLALGLGIFVLARRKGTKSHKMAGKIWLCLMLAVATTAIFIREINDGSFSWIHIFVPVTFFASWEVVHYIRKGNVARHKRAVTGMFFGALLIPGAFSFMPGRTMWMIVFGG